MKVYELMSALAKMDAGADVRISTLISTEEFLKGNKLEDDLTSLTFAPCEVDEGYDSGVVNISTEVLF